MPYPQELLNKHEKVVVDSHPHWLYFLEPMLAVAAAFAVYFIFVISNRVDITWGWTRFLLFVLACLGLWALLRLIRWRSVEFVVTNDRVIYRSGVFAKRGIEIPLARVNNVNFSQGILERMVGAGNLMIESGGEDGQSHFTDVRDPQQVQRIIHEQIEVYRQRPTGARPVRPGPLRDPDATATSGGRRGRACLSRGGERGRRAGEARGPLPSGDHHAGRVRGAEAEAAGWLSPICCRVPRPVVMRPAGSSAWSPPSPRPSCPGASSRSR